MNDQDRLDIIKLKEDLHSFASISRELGIPVSTVKDFCYRETWKSWWSEYDKKIKIPVFDRLSQREDSVPCTPIEEEVDEEESADFYQIATTVVNKPGGDHFVIPDTQCKPGVSLEHLHWVGEYIVDRKPDVIVHLGDHADMPSLSSYDRGKRSAEGRRVREDINAAIEGMNALLRPLYEYQKMEMELYGGVKYKPRMVLTLGNHEERIVRHVNANPELYGFLSYDDLKYSEMGWEVYDFLKPVVIDGVAYCHFMANPMSGKPYGGQCLNILKQVGESFTMGHKQLLDVATRFLPASGKQQWGLVAGACYTHDEDYKGHQGNHHWRGIIVKHGVSEGSYNPMFIDLGYLERKFGGSNE